MSLVVTKDSVHFLDFGDFGGSNSSFCNESFGFRFDLRWFVKEDALLTGKGLLSSPEDPATKKKGYKQVVVPCATHKQSYQPNRTKLKGLHSL